MRLTTSGPKDVVKITMCFAPFTLFIRELRKASFGESDIVSDHTRYWNLLRFIFHLVQGQNMWILQLINIYESIKIM